MFTVNGRTLQYLAAISAAVLTGSQGIALVWTSPVLPDLMKDDSPIGVRVSQDEASLIASLLQFGAICGNIIIGPSIDYFGRKGTLLISSVPIFLCWIMIIFARSVIVLYIARFVMGVFLSVPAAISAVYSVEIGEAKIRGTLSFLCSISSEASSILTVIIGSYVSYKTLALLASFFPLVFFISFIFMPESPFFHLKNGNYERAEHCLLRLRDSVDVNEELEQMKKTVEDNNSDNSALFDLFRITRFRRSLLIIMGLKVLHQFSGSIAIQNYMKIIFTEVNTGLDPDTSSMISIAVALPATIIATLAVDKLGRKINYYISTLGCTFALICVSVYFYVQHSPHGNAEAISWLPVTGIFFFFIFKSFGIAYIPYILISEFFPPNVKGKASSVVLVFGSVLASLVSWGFPQFSEAFGMGVSFLIFASCCFIGFWFVLFLVKETKGVSLAEIQSVVKNKFVLADE